MSLCSPFGDIRKLWHDENESVLIAEEEKGRLIKEVEELRKSHVAHLAEISAIRNELEDQKKNVPGSDHDEKVSLTQRLEKAEEANNTLNEEIRAASKELGKIRFQLQGSESSLAKERKMSEALSAQLQSVVSSSQEEALRKDEELKILRAKVEEQEAQMKTMKTEKNAADKRFKELEEEYAAFRADQRPEIRTELERRYEESKYRLNEALEQIHSYEKLIESGKKTGQQDGILNAKLSSELIQVKEFNSHLERQFLAQSEIIETLKQKLLKNRSFYERINKMVELEDASRIQEELVMFSRENNSDEGKLASNIALIIKDIRKNTFYSPLQISTTHHKIRPYSSVDSSAEWQSNSSEGIVSPDENDE
uniref:Uncharacterized protein n=1 Tax=Caenorhabditis japonica TaxID=281687 RepID=A0A8R1HRM2_CAEJA